MPKKYRLSPGLITLLKLSKTKRYIFTFNFKSRQVFARASLKLTGFRTPAASSGIYNGSIAFLFSYKTAFFISLNLKIVKSKSIV